MTDIEQRIAELEAKVERLETLLDYYQPAMREAKKLIPLGSAQAPDRVDIPSTCLQEQIESAKKSMDEWPEWMKRSRERRFIRRNENE